MVKKCSIREVRTGMGVSGKWERRDLVAVPCLGGCSVGVLDEGDEDVEEDLSVGD